MLKSISPKFFDQLENNKVNYKQLNSFIGNNFFNTQKLPENFFTKVHE